MTTVEQDRIRKVERQKRMIIRRIRRRFRKTYADYCVISTNGLFEETIDWLGKLGYKVFLYNE